jgi:mRNA interferase MazF
MTDTDSSQGAPSERVPDRGDMVYLDFNPTKGREQRGYRPAVIISPAAYNAKSSLALFLPITSKQKGYPFEVLLPEGLQVRGVILADQIKSLGWRMRDLKFVETLPLEVMAEVRGKIKPLIFDR